MSQSKFTLSSSFKPTGEQPKAIAELVNGINGGEKHLTRTDRMIDSEKRIGA